MTAIQAEQVISSQQYLDWDMVEAKTAELQGGTELVLGVWATGLVDCDGQPVYLLFDGHHRFAAAQELELPVRFELVDQPEGLTGEDLLAQNWMDSDWRYITNDRLVW